MHVVEMLHERQTPLYSVWSIPWLLMPYWHKNLGHQQPWYWSSSRGISLLDHQKGDHRNKISNFTNMEKSCDTWITPFWCWSWNILVKRYHSCSCPGSLFCQVISIRVIDCPCRINTFFVFHKIWFQSPAPSQCRVMIENANMFLCFLKIISVWQA